MKSGDKVKVIKGEYSGRIGWIKSVNLLDDGTYTKTNITIIDEHKHTYDVNKNDIERLEG
jgi:ribosomal protein L24